MFSKATGCENPVVFFMDSPNNSEIACQTCRQAGGKKRGKNYNNILVLSARCDTQMSKPHEGMAGMG